MLVVAAARRQCFDRDAPAKHRIFGDVNDAHAALAELFNESDNERWCVRSYL